jgi:hypothetical protein
MISSVQNIQSSINENVIGMVKGISDNLMSNPVVDTFSKTNPTTISTTQNQKNSITTETNPQNFNFNQNINTNSKFSSSNPKIQIDKKDLIAIDKTILNNEDMVTII